MKAIILTLEENSQMNSKLPKVLNEILGKKMISYCIDTLKGTGLFSEIYICVSAKADIIKEALSNTINCVSIDELASIYGEGDIMLMNGDSPLVTPEAVVSFYDAHIKSGEEITKAPSFMFIKSSLAGKAEPCSGEADGEFMTVNTKLKLYEATEILKKRINEKHMLNGVTIINLRETYISPGVVIGKDTVVYPNTYISGATVIGEDCIIGPDCSLKNMTVGDCTEILSTTAMDSSIGSHTHVGPYAFIRPHSQIGDNVKIGDFVEVKNSVIGNNSKASHLAYIGDAELGENVNFGCAVITCNYDGKHKHKTIIGDNVFIGCNTNLVAPVKVGESAYIAAGSTITDDVPAKVLAIARARQVIKLNWRKNVSETEKRTEEK